MSDVQQCVVDSRVFLLGLDALYRKAMKRHERVELLACARTVAQALSIRPADVPIEGYYDEDESLVEYFRLVRALQAVARDRTGEVAHLPAFVRLEQVASAPVFGRPQNEDRLLPVGRDALSQALHDTRATRSGWTIPALVAAASDAARTTDDISLVGLAARAEDPVVLAALRESVVLYAMRVALGRASSRAYVWQVDEALAAAARRFIDAFNALFGDHLPPPIPKQAEQYWEANDENEVVGRCVRLGFDDTQSPVRHYHWAICRGSGSGLIVQDFWRDAVWTTAAYRRALGLGGRCPDLSRPAGEYGDIDLPG